MYEMSHNSTIDLTVAAVAEEASEECFQELEWINKEIESVKHQVEEEQRRLSHYQTLERTNKCSSSVFEVMRKNGAQDSSHTFLSKPCSKPKKYILDRSKPRTDLEYDPLSNFSSDLRSYCSSEKVQKSTNGHFSKTPKQSTQNQKNLHAQIAPLPKHSSEDSDSNEDDILIIDLSPSPAKNKTKNVCNFVTDNTSGVVSPNVSGSTAIEQNHKPSNLISSKTATNTYFIPNDENIFVKMTQRLSDYNPDPPHPNEQKTLSDRSSSNNAAPVNKTTLTHELAPPGINRASASSPSLANVKARKMEEQERNQPIAPQQPQIVFVGSLCEPQDILSAVKLASNDCDQQNQQMPTKEEDVILIDSSSENELNYSDMDISESDPDEECYRIFMEANGEKKSSEPRPQLVRNAEAEKVNFNLQPKVVPGKKRVAHESKVTEQPVAKVRPQPQVLVPFRAPVSLTSKGPALPRIRKEEQRASVLTTSIKARQALVSKVHSDVQRIQTTQCSVTAKPAPYVTHLSVGATVIDVGNNLHLVLPEGTFPMSDSSGQVTSVLTPITPDNANSVSSVPTPVRPANTANINMKRACPSSTQSQQRRNSQPVIIPPLAHRPVTAATSPSQCSPMPVPVAKPVATKRKLKPQCEIAKVPHDLRQSYVNKFTEEFLKTTSNVQVAFEKALVEEKVIYNRSANKLKYMSVAVNALKKLRNQSGAVEVNHQTSQKIKGNIPLNPGLLNGKGVIMFECLKDYVMTEEMLIENNFPLQNPEKPGSAILFADNKKHFSDPLRKLCCRCGATYSVSRTGKHTRKEECTYHYGKGVENKVPGGVETRYSCCQGIIGSPGCQVFKVLNIPVSFSVKWKFYVLFLFCSYMCVIP
ncbi:hypothetical protein WMY93_005236 [Mugilogobius chulae]|uniref:RNA exonuclease 1 homolog-like domain-containing protein n=1 Tax=Mugilogobius chulae TaxID=88201 RepID=A0AAW0Q5P0_9GOBI